MERSIDYKWVVILFFGIVGVMFMASVFFLTTGRIPADTYWGRKMRLPDSTDTVLDRSPSKFVLELDKGKKIGKYIFFYKGFKDDHIFWDVIIPELDAQHRYPMKVSVKKARKGFEIADCTLRLETLRNNFTCVTVVD